MTPDKELEELLTIVERQMNERYYYSSNEARTADVLNTIQHHFQSYAEGKVREERENIVKMLKTIHFRDMQPKETRSKYLQQSKGCDYLRNKLLKALTPPLTSDNKHIKE